MAYGIVFCLLLQGDVVQAIAQRDASRAARGEAVAAGRKTDAGSSHSPDDLRIRAGVAGRVAGDGPRDSGGRAEPAGSFQPCGLAHARQARRRNLPASCGSHAARDSTPFGPATLRRLGYRSDAAGEPSLFPLEEALGLRHGCTPALAERVGFHAGQAGATQRTLLDLLKRDHGVTMGVGRLRQLLSSLSDATAPLRREAQARRIRDLLQRAFAGRDAASPRWP